MDPSNKKFSVSLNGSFLNIPWAWLMTALPLIAICGRLFLKKKNALDWEKARRKARIPYKKDDYYYAKHGVKSSEAFILNSRNIEIFTKQWLPIDGPLKGLIFYCHGYSDTCAYLFEDVAIRLASSHYVVASMDYEGHGQSEGLHVYIKRFDTIVEDVLEYAKHVKQREEFRGLPTFLYGESMGGAVAIKAHLFDPNLWDGAILLAPMCKIADHLVPPAFVVFLLKALALIFPTWKIVPTKDICEVCFRDRKKLMQGRENPTSQKGKPRLGTAVQLLKTTKEIGRRLSEVTLPLLILHGEADVVTDPSISQALYDQSFSKDKTFRLYPDSWHSLLSGEPDEIVDVVFSDIFTWLDARSLQIDAVNYDLSSTMNKVSPYLVYSDEDVTSTLTG